MAATRLPGGQRSVEEGDSAQVATPTGRQQVGRGGNAYGQLPERMEAPAQRDATSDRLSENAAETEGSAGQRTQGNRSETIKGSETLEAEARDFFLGVVEQKIKAPEEMNGQAQMEELYETLLPVDRGDGPGARQQQRPPSALWEPRAPRSVALGGSSSQASAASLCSGSACAAEASRWACVPNASRYIYF
ncbi:unnamed protein product [Lampetra fluviatilis]